MRILLLVAGCLAGLLCGVVPAKSQGSPVTVDTCRALIDQYGVPEQDPTLMFQGGSQQAAQVAFCQSLLPLLAAITMVVAALFLVRAQRRARQPR